MSLYMMTVVDGSKPTLLCCLTRELRTTLRHVG